MSTSIRTLLRESDGEEFISKTDLIEALKVQADALKNQESASVVRQIALNIASMKDTDNRILYDN